MRNTLARASFRTAINLLFFSVIGTFVLASMHHLTEEPIKRSVEMEKKKLISQILPHALYDNDIVNDRIDISPDKLLGTHDVAPAYRARLNGEPSAVVLEAIAPDGYSGKIWLILAIRANGEVAGVRVVNHHETPGLGDYIELPKSPWIKGFDGKSHANLPEPGWKVKKDGGQFDYMAGATITPRAIVKAVNKALKYYQANREQLFAAPPPAGPGKA
jgi:electron transport complex protein RnfG